MPRSLCNRTLPAVGLALIIGGCAPTPPAAAPARGATPGGSSASARATASKPPETVVLAYVNGQPVTLAQVREPLLESAGGQTLAEVVVDRALQERLAAAGLTLMPEQVDAERALLVQTLQPRDEDEATLILRELRRRRGLGEQRFAELLRRNAAMRLLVQDQVQVTPQALERAYQVAHGERYQARVITVPRLADAQRLRKQIAAGEATFADLAVAHSTDATAARGGLLPPISPADPAYPPLIRQTLVKLGEQGNRLSDVIALDSGYALLHLERKDAAESVELADVQDELAQQVRRSAERVLMQQLARELLAQANVVVLDPTLARSWEWQKGAMIGP